MCTKNYNHMRYGSWDTAETGRMRQAEIFVILDLFLPFYPSPPKKSSLEQPGDIILLHLCSINEGHVIYDSWNIRHDRQNFLSFWTIICPFTTLTIRKIKVLKNWKKNTWRYYHFTHMHHKLQSYDVWYLRYQVQRTERLVILDGFLPFYPSSNSQNQNFGKMKRNGSEISFYICVP